MQSLHGVEFRLKLVGFIESKERHVEGLYDLLLGHMYDELVVVDKLGFEERLENIAGVEGESPSLRLVLLHDYTDGL